MSEFPKAQMKRLRQETYEPRKRPKTASLIEAVKRNDVKEVKQLLNAGADVHAENNYALHCASVGGHAEMVSLLLNAGADVHASGDSNLQLASMYGHVEVVSLLLDAGADVHAFFDLALGRASLTGHSNVVALLLNAGADVHTFDDNSLHIASSYRHVGVCYLLLSVGANPEKCSKEMLVKVKEHVCSRLMDSVDLPTCLNNDIICKFLIGY